MWHPACGRPGGSPSSSPAYRTPNAPPPPRSCPSSRYGFVRYGSVTEAQAAIGTLDGTSVLGHTLQVKFADADAGAGARSGRLRRGGLSTALRKRPLHRARRLRPHPSLCLAGDAGPAGGGPPRGRMPACGAAARRLAGWGCGRLGAPIIGTTCCAACAAPDSQRQLASAACTTGASCVADGACWDRQTQAGLSCAAR